MNARASLAIIAGVATVCAIALAVSTQSLRSARRASHRADVRLAQVTSDGERILALRARSQTTASAQQPQQDVYQRTKATLSAAGLGRVRVQSVTPAGERAVEAAGAPGPDRRVQSVRIILEPVTLDELGTLLDRWRQDQPLWTVTAIDCAHAARDTTDSYRVTLTASAVYFAETATAPTLTVSTPTPTRLP